MTEIKFKAWDRKLKCWFQPVYEANEGKLLFLTLNLNGSLSMTKIDGRYGTDEDSLPYSERFEIMQYIGLKDKNEKSIYQRDVRVWDHPQDHFLNGRPVEFKNGAFGLETKRGFMSFFQALELQEDIMDQYEIIGNQPENPELINDILPGRKSEVKK